MARMHCGLADALALPMAPSIATRDGKPVLALGTPGSYGICQTQPQALIQHVDFGLGIQDAIDAPRARLLDGRLVAVELRIGAEIDRGTARTRPCSRNGGDWTTAVGGMHGIAIDPVYRRHDRRLRSAARRVRGGRMRRYGHGTDSRNAAASLVRGSLEPGTREQHR